MGDRLLVLPIRWHLRLRFPGRPLMMPNQYRRSGGVSPVPSPLRSTFLSGEVPSVEPGGAPLGVRLTSLGVALAVVAAVVVFCLALWTVFLLLAADLFIVALASVCAFLLGFGLVEKRRNKNLNK